MTEYINSIKIINIETEAGVPECCRSGVTSFMTSLQTHSDDKYERKE